MVHAYAKGFPAATLPGWRREGWAKMVKGNENRILNLGVTRSFTRGLPSYVYIFSRKGQNIALPGSEWVKRNLVGFTVNGGYTVIVAEENGTPVEKPEVPGFGNVVAGGRCPEKLHDTWVVPTADSSDPDTANRKFRTFHSLWDPCFWCAYSHEHGSDPVETMGYSPRFGYIAWKNERQNESHNGFKSHVLRYGKYYIYYGLHNHLSQASRFFTRFHTLVIVIVDAKSKEKMLELGFKADFGFEAVRKAGGGRLALTPEGEVLYAEQKMRGSKGFLMRLVNVINPGNLNPLYSYRDPIANVMHGRYEQWLTIPMCSKVQKLKEPKIDIKDPGTALRTKDSDANDIVTLFRKADGTEYQQKNVNREFRATDWTIGADFCEFEGGQRADGVFYTDVYGKKILPGPSRNAVRQFIKPGFKLTLSGHFESTDSWLGVLTNGGKGSMRDVGYAIDASMN